MHLVKLPGLQKEFSDFFLTSCEGIMLTDLGQMNLCLKGNKIFYRVKKELLLLP